MCPGLPKFGAIAVSFGSVKASNAAEILAKPDIDGALVGGASLDGAEFAAICAAACAPAGTAA